MDEQKWSSCTWLLMKEFVKLRVEQEEEVRVFSFIVHCRLAADKVYWQFARKVESGEVDEIEAALEYLPLPTVPFVRRCQLACQALPD